jgi:hypothetical protein
MQYKTITVPHTYQVPVGYWLVTFFPVWNIDEDTGYESIAEVDGNVQQVTEDDIHLADMSIDTNTSNHYGDTHDLRDRLFSTKSEAEEHMRYTLNRFCNPQPWESFVCLK